MTQQHPITPPPELVEQWMQDHATKYDLARHAVQWGADQELDACCEWLQDPDLNVDTYKLRAARRPKPPSLKKQALAELDLLKGDANAHGLGFDASAIRRALESLPE
jgi:hypothetical protein